jgi:hypothetical protein
LENTQQQSNNQNSESFATNHIYLDKLLIDDQKDTLLSFKDDVSKDNEKSKVKNENSESFIDKNKLKSLNLSQKYVDYFSSLSKEKFECLYNICRRIMPSMKTKTESKIV